jgi:hypothetical protein
MIEINLERLTILSRHPVLDQVARDIARGVAVEDLPDQDIIVCIGAHKRFAGLRHRQGFKIFVQTEHFFDAEGMPLWRKPIWFRTLVNLFLCDLILDLSSYNKTVYQWLPARLRKKIVFGPRIFPSHPVRYAQGNGKVLFYGTINERRERLIKENSAFTTLENEVFGSALEQSVAQASAVLNLHFVDARYTEYPRLLSAYLAGKPVVSDILSPELVAGRHYLPLTASLNAEALASAFEAFSVEFAAKNRFTDFLSRSVSPSDQ